MDSTKKDSNFYSDLCYYIKKKANLLDKKDKSIEKRINKRLKRVHVPNSHVTYMSEFENLFYKFCMEIAFISNDPELFSDYTKISKYPHLTELKLKELEPATENPKIKVLK